jgi:hypothetical protein
MLIAVQGHAATAHIFWRFGLERLRQRKQDLPRLCYCSVASLKAHPNTGISAQLAEAVHEARIIASNSMTTVRR